MNQEICAAIAMSSMLFKEYWENKLMRRLAYNFPQFSNIQELIANLKMAHWQRVNYYTNTRQKNLQLFKTNDFGGLMGLLPLKAASQNTFFELRKFNQTTAMLIARGTFEKVETGSTLLTIGVSDNKQVAFDVLPGEHIEKIAIELPTTGLKNGRLLTKQQALKLGFVLAKVLA